MVRNGYHAEREVTTAAGAVPVRAPRVNDKRVDEATGERQRFSSAILPAWARKSPQVAEVLPLLYLHGLSTCDFAPALEQFLGSAHGLSAATITRLTSQWQDDARAFGSPVAGRGRLRVPVGRRHPPQGPPRAGQGVPAGDDRRPRRRHQGAGRPGRRASASQPSRGPTCCATASAAGCAPRCSRSATARWGSGRRSATCSPRPASSGAGGTRSATSSPRCPSPPSPARRRRWPRSTTPRTRPTRSKAAKAFAADYGAKWPKAVAKITDDLDVLLAFYDFPAEHWVHLRTTNPIESTFATVRLRQRVTKGPGSRAAGIAMAFKLIESAQARWRAVNAPHLVALVRAGAQFENGKLVERPDESGGDTQAA